MMSKYLFLVMLNGFGWAVQAQTVMENPLAYFDFFNQEHAQLAHKNMEYLQYAVHDDDIRVIAEKRLALLRQVRESKARIARLPDDDRDAGLKSTMLAVLATYEELFEISFEEVELLKMDAREGFAEMERYLKAQTAAEERMAAAGGRLLDAQRRFAEAHNIQLQLEPDSVTEAQQLNELNDYQRGIFLRGFRVDKLNTRFLLAVEEDGADAEAARLQLLNVATEELPLIKDTPAYNGNTEYRDAVLAQVKLLRNLARDDYPALVTVKRKGDALTNEDITAYNTAIGKINTMLNPATERVNAALQQLLRDNVPKPALKGVKRI